MKRLKNLVSTAACFTCLAVTLSGAAVRGEQGEDQEGGAPQGDLARRWIDAWNSHDSAAVAALFTRGGVYEDVTLGIVNRGADEIRAFAQLFFTAVPDLHMSLVNSSLKDGHGAIEWVFSGTDQGVYATGKTFAVRGVTVLETRGVKISRNSDYFDLATVLRQLALLPPGL